MRLIDWDNVLEWMHRQKETTEQWSMRIAIENYVDEMPTIDPVKHGHWVDFRKQSVPWDEMNHGCPDGSAYCSECGEWLTASDEFPCVGRYCPNCGAKMDGENDETY